MKTRRTFTDEFKQQTVRLLEGGGKPLARVARELGVSDPVLRCWRERFGRAGSTRPPQSQAVALHDTLTLADMAAENARLQAEVKRLEMHTQILRKAIAVDLLPITGPPGTGISELTWSCRACCHGHVLQH
jgi:transposase